MVSQADDTEQGKPQTLVGRYKRLLQGAPHSGAFESVGGGEPDLSEGGIHDRLSSTRGALHDIVTEFLGGSSDLYALADQIVEQGGDALRVVRDEDEDRLRERPADLASLEVIVRTDGSRPSFMVREGIVDRSTSPIGTWADTLDASSVQLNNALACVGRIDVPGSPAGFLGTGFLIGENLIVTNRHVLQALGAHADDGSWELAKDAAIDFGHEFRARASVNRRALRRVVFTGSQPIKMAGPADHTKLDMAVIELEPAPSHVVQQTPLSVDAAPDWAEPDLSVFIVGYPANPSSPAYTPTLLEQLFQTTFGCKRLAPGQVMISQAQLALWTAAHDATTLGGNSGSVLLVVGREHAAAGLHYGGTLAEPRENWGHVLGLALDQTDGQTSTTLREHLTNFGVRFVDRATSG